MKKGLLIGLVLLLLFIAGGISVGAYYNSLLFKFTKQSEPTPTPVMVDKEEKDIDDKVLPDLFPESFPIYPNAKLINSWTIEEEEKAVSIVWETEDDLDSVINFYEENLTQSNWDIIETLDATGSATISFKGELGEGFVGVSDKTGSSDISVTIGLE